jgi:hypothetical protein
MICEGCGIEFTPRTRKQRFHSRACANNRKKVPKEKPVKLSPAKEEFYKLYGIMPTKRGLSDLKKWKKNNNLGEMRSAIASSKGRHLRKDMMVEIQVFD